MFGAALDRARRYAELLAGPGVDRGLIGPREPARLWTRHLLNCGVVADLLPTDCSVADVGSGAGLPGIPVALARPDCDVVLVEPLLRRATFLTDVVRELDLPRCRVVRARAEDLVAPPGPRRRNQDSAEADEPIWREVDVVTSRAVAALDVLAAWCVPLMRPGGRLLALKGSSAPEEARGARAALERLGLVDVEILEAGVGLLDPPTLVVSAVLRQDARLRRASTGRRRPRR